MTQSNNSVITGGVGAGWIFLRACIPLKSHPLPVAPWGPAPGGLLDALSAVRYSVSLEPATHHACPHPIANLVRAAGKALSTLHGSHVLRVSEWGFLSVPAPFP